jgi:hypothetical protein
VSGSAERPVDPETCTAVLLSVPKPVAERIESFLTMNGIACRIRLNAEMQGGAIDASGIQPVWDVLVRPEDLPGEEAAPARPARLNVPVSGALVAEEPAEMGPPGTEESPGGPVILCELPWNDAWALTQRLNAAGIPAAGLAPEEPDRDRPMAARIVPVGVRPEDLERARSFD